MSDKLHEQRDGSDACDHAGRSLTSEDALPIDSEPGIEMSAICRTVAAFHSNGDAQELAMMV